jgi:hypothetical protein
MRPPPDPAAAPPPATCDVAQSDAARLVYVRVPAGDRGLAGALLHVTAFRARPEADRREAVCPACEAPVTIRLGEVRVPHAAHRPGTGAGCAAASGESALHLNAKVHLAEVLGTLGRARGPEGEPLALALACAGAPDCPVPAPVDWIGGWDAVRVECRVDARRPDLVLLRGAAEVAAVEVRVSHAVDAEKAAALRASGLPWVEVRAEAVWGGSPDRSWDGTTPLPVARAAREVGRWRCPRHEAERMLEGARRAYRALRVSATAARKALAARGRALADMEAATRAALHEAAAVRVRIASEEAVFRVHEDEFPAQLRAAEARRAEAEEALELAKADASERRAALARRRERLDAARGRLAGLNAEARRSEELRRALSAEFGPPAALDAPGGPGLLGPRTLCFRVVDTYRTRGPGGRPRATRAVLRVDRRPVPGKTPELWLVLDHDRCLRRIEADAPGAEATLRAAVDRHLDERRRAGARDGALVDAGPWVAVPPGQAMPDDDIWRESRGRFARAYVWDETRARWALPAPAAAPTPRAAP